jgi:hypothetical protein
MAGAIKHMKRSHRSYGKNVDFRMFERKAQIKRAQLENKSLFQTIKDTFKK